jgi:hypothetical protein
MNRTLFKESENKIKSIIPMLVSLTKREDEKEALTKEKGWKNFLSIDEQISIKLKTENRAFKVNFSQIEHTSL